MDTRHYTDAREYRNVGGQLVSMASADTHSTHVELLSRESSGSIEWQFRQARLALLWFQSGVSAMHLRLNGKRIDTCVSAGANLALVPAFTDIEGEFTVARHCDYAVIFLDTKWVGKHLECEFDLPLLAFGNQDILKSLPKLCSEVRSEAPLYELFVEGWALQTLALLSRLIAGPERTQRPRGGLTEASFKRTREFIASDLSRPFTIDELAGVAGFSARHFIRAFQESTGQTPFRFIMALRIERAKQLLATTPSSSTEIALECGFSHAQHFTNSFRNATGVTPSTYRKSVLA